MFCCPLWFLGFPGMKYLPALRDFPKHTLSISLFQTHSGVLVCTSWKLCNTPSSKYCSELDYFMLKLWLLEHRLQLWTLFSLFNFLTHVGTGAGVLFSHCSGCQTGCRLEHSPRTSTCLEVQLKRKIFGLCHLVTIYSHLLGQEFTKRF